MAVANLQAHAAAITVALAGNPNVGKTSVFNNLTGARQHVGNWPGVTVEKKEGSLIAEGRQVQIVDLPGIYGLGAYSEDEIIARDYILSRAADVVVNVVDASNLERNLYLTLQLVEAGANVVMALNVIDEAQARGINIDAGKLSKVLGVPVIPTVAPKKRGMQELITTAIRSAGEDGKAAKVTYGEEVEKELAKLESLITGRQVPKLNHPPRWLALKLLEGDDVVKGWFQNDAAVMDQVGQSSARLEEITGQDAESLIVEGRYGFIAGVVKGTVTRKRTTEERLTVSDKIDRVVTHRVLGIPIFLAAMWAVFQFTFTLGGPLIGYVEVFFEWLGGLAGARIGNELLASLVVDGVIGGLGSILVFIPPIFLLFLAISLLEDSGYMARGAYIMDRIMHSLGLHGKSFIPLLVGFGCSVPAVMATRTLENKRDRMITLLIAPLMSCAARLPVYVLFVGVFFTARQGLVIFSLYMLGVVLAILMGFLFKTFLFKGEQSPFVMELPPYRIPTLKGTLIHVWERGYSFIRKAGTIIFGVVVLIWLLSNLPWGAPVEQTIIGRLGSFMAPIYSPCGFGTWEAAVALFFGILAKEVVVGTLGIVYGVGEEGLGAVLAQYFTPLSAYAFMAMTLLYIPCVATIGAIRREAGWGWTAFAIGYTLALGWVVAVIIYQGGRLLGLG